jgi:hypothetical protein
MVSAALCFASLCHLSKSSKKADEGRDRDFVKIAFLRRDFDLCCVQLIAIFQEWAQKQPDDLFLYVPLRLSRPVQHETFLVQNRAEKLAATDFLPADPKTPPD